MDGGEDESPRMEEFAAAMDREDRAQTFPVELKKTHTSTKTSCSVLVARGKSTDGAIMLVLVN